jgi:hypothetical protein
MNKITKMWTAETTVKTAKVTRYLFKIGNLCMMTLVVISLISKR